MWLPVTENILAAAQYGARMVSPAAFYVYGPLQQIPAKRTTRWRRWVRKGACGRYSSCSSRRIARAGCLWSFRASPTSTDRVW